MSNMWMVVAAGIVLGGLTVALQLMKASRQRRSSSPAKNPYSSLREQALTLEASQAAITAAPGQAWSAVMDMWVGDATVTVVAFADGTASIYLSSGGGFIGGGQQHETIRAAAARFLSTATAALAQMKPADAHPLPAPGRVAFYVPPHCSRRATA